MDKAWFRVAGHRQHSGHGLRMRGLVALLALLNLPAIAAQDHPDFSGSWIVIQTPLWIRQMLPKADDLESHLEVKQSALFLTSTTRIVPKTPGTGARPPKPLPPSTLYLDGRERTTKQPDAAIQTTRTSWEGRSLVTKIARTKAGQTLSLTTITWSLDADGRLLVASTLEKPGMARPARDLMILRRSP